MLYRCITSQIDNDNQSVRHNAILTKRGLKHETETVLVRLSVSADAIKRSSNENDGTTDCETSLSSLSGQSIQEGKQKLGRLGVLC